MGNVIDISYRFRDKKSKEYDPVIAQKIEVLQDWFKSLWPDAELNVNFIFSRVVGEELEIKREIVYKNRNTRHIITSTTGIHRHTWTSPFLMEQFLDKFVQDQMRSITDIMSVRKNTYNRYNNFEVRLEDG